MKQKSYREILDLVAADSLEEQTSLWPQIASRLERKTIMTTLRARPMLAVLIALLILFILSGVAYAIGRSLGYIPGVGMIDQSVPLRVLAEPVSVTRDGITFTIEDAILSSDKTIILYTIENAPITEIYQDHAVIGCTSASNLRLPNGKSFASFDLLMEKGRMTFDPMPATINDAILFIPCLPNTAPRTAPENWELSMRFVPAPPERVNSLPVMEYTSPAPSVTSAGVENEGAGQNAFFISKAVDAGDSYILMGEFRPFALKNSFDRSIKLIDANDAEVLWEVPGDIDPTFSPGSEFWAAQFDKKQAFPIRVEYSELIVNLDAANAESYEFDFDMGTDSEIGQVWNLNREIQLAGYEFTLSSIGIRKGGGCFECISQFEYVFSFASPEFVTQTILDQVPHLPAHSLSFLLPDGRLNNMTIDMKGYRIGGGGMSAAEEQWEIGIQQPNLIKGRVKIQISNLPGRIETKKQTLNWQPDGYTPPSNSSASSAPQPCLTFDSWKAVLADPAPIPANLGGKVALNLLNEDLASFHISISKLDGSDQKIINNTQYASLSPDGKQAVYTRIGEGLYLMDLSTGEEHLLPYAEQNDSRPYWLKPFWSPDGTKLSYINDGFYVINVDGTGLRKIFDGNTIFDSFGWSSDSEKLFVNLINPNGFPKITEVDLATNATRDLLSAQSQEFITWAAAVSPDGSRIAFVRTYGGSGTQIIYISNTDGSNLVPVARSDEGWNFSSSLVWSVDGQWLLISVSDTKNDPYVLHPMNALVNPQTCQIIQLPLEGNVQSWAP